MKWKNLAASAADVRDAVDELHRIRLELATLKEREAIARKTILDSGQDEVSGSNGIVATVEFLVTHRINWERIARDLGVSNQRIVGNTTPSEVRRVKLWHDRASGRSPANGATPVHVR